MERVTVGSDSKNGVRHQRALSPRLSMMMMTLSTTQSFPLHINNPRSCREMRFESKMLLKPKPAWRFHNALIKTHT